ncbi:MAG: hypothetical protein U0800_24970 [Isosphaeraceae bacterium]
MMPQLSWIGLVLILGLPFEPVGDEHPAIRDDFEGPRPAWRQERTDAQVNLRHHERTDATSHDGDRSERFDFVAGPGSGVYFSYPLPRVAIVRDLKASVHLRADHAGAQLLGRVILPADVNPDTGQPSFITIAGPIYASADRWQKLELRDFPEAVAEQVRSIQARERRTVRTEGAYLERLILNLYGGAGESEVFVDDLLVQPVDNRPAEMPGASEGPEPDPSAPFALRRNRLDKGGYPWIFRAIEAPGADPARLRRAAFDVWSFPIDSDEEGLRAAREAEFLLMPRFEYRGEDPSEVLARISRLPDRDRVAFWHLGDDLGAELGLEARAREREQFRELLANCRERQATSPGYLTGSLVGDHSLFGVAPRLDLFGFEVRNRGLAIEPIERLQTLSLYRNLTGLSVPNGFYWTSVRMAAPPGLSENIWGPYAPPSWGSPRLAPETIRLAAYSSLMAGYRGLRFEGDAELTRPPGRPRLIEATLLNAEIDLVESILAQAGATFPVSVFPPDPVKQIVYSTNGAPSPSSKSARSPETPSHPWIKAMGFAVREGDGPPGTLMLLAYLVPWGLVHPPGMAESELHVRVPGSAQSPTAVEISLGGLKTLKKTRVPGGWDVKLNDFNTTSIVLVTGDNELIARLNTVIAGVRPRAVRVAYDSAEIQFRWAKEIESLLLNDQHPLKEIPELLAKVEKTLQAANEMQARGEWSEAWAEIQRARQGIRIVMRSYAEDAIEDLRDASNPTPYAKGTRSRLVELANRMPQIVPPVSSPPLQSFNTLPEAYLWNYRIRNGSLGPNLLPDDGFEAARPDEEGAWWNTHIGREEEAILPRIELLSREQARKKTPAEEKAQGKKPVRERLNEGKYLRLTAGVPDAAAIAKELPFQNQPLVAIRTPSVPVRAGQLVRIGVKLKMDRNLPTGNLGLFVQDSIGGERSSTGPATRSRNGPSWCSIARPPRTPT